MCHLMRTVYFKTDKQMGSVEICDTGWGKSQMTPEELEQKIEVTETDIEAIKKDIERLESEINELKFKIIKKYVYLIYGLLVFQKRTKEKTKAHG